MDVLALIATLDDLVHNAKPIRFTNQVRVDKQRIYEILDQIRATVPEEIKQARWIVKERQDMLAEARREAERIVRPKLRLSIVAFCPDFRAFSGLGAVWLVAT
jgi:hypothetical protein